MTQSMLVDAVKARLPLITVRARDLLNFEDTFKFLTDVEVVKTNATQIANPQDLVFPKKEKHHLLICEGKEEKIVWAKQYSRFLNKGASLIIVNPPKPIAESFEAGEVEPSREHVRAVLQEAYASDEDGVLLPEDSEQMQFVESLLPALGGLSLKEIGEVVRLAEARHGSLNARGVMQTRALLVPDMPGFSAVNTAMSGPYLPNENLSSYAHENKALFLSPDTDPRLVPKGLLFDGPSGTGKTQGAKWLANEWGVPLYKLDSTILNKYYGESEQNLRSVFSRVAHEAPCILFLDEVEKMFGNTGSEGGQMMGRLLGMLLWFMQEGRERVFVAMTSNRKELLPDELMRPGRLDKVLTFEGLTFPAASQFAKVVANSFSGVKIPFVKLSAAVKELYDDTKAGDRASHADVTERVHSLVKEALNEQHGG